MQKAVRHGWPTQDSGLVREESRAEYVHRKPNMFFNLPSLVSLVFTFSGVSCLCFHLSVLYF